MVEIVLAMVRLPVLKSTPSSGVSKVVPQVGQPAPMAIRPVIMPARSRLAAFCSLLFSHKRATSPMRIPCKSEILKIGNQSRKGWLMPKVAMMALPIILRLFGKPRAPMSSNLAKPP